ncbi:MAG TPA: hypothetical protein VGQ32_11025 [Thermoanaerobaculia bacterium]|nr:hypothetical protein [Thermoanaerobaculia bacterium]
MDTNRLRDRIGRFLRRAALLGIFWTPTLFAETVTLPVAASVSGSGGVPFVSDVRVFNTSYTDVVAVTAVYRFNGATQTFQLAPREAKAFDDIAVSLFAAPGSLGAIEFTSPASQGTIVVSSQLRSPVSTGGFVGMFIPGLAPTDAGSVTVLTGLVNGDSRTNIGVYNPNNNSINATIRLFDGSVLLGSTSVGLGPHGVTQVNNIYGVVGFGSLSTTNGHATVESSDGPLFTYAAQADNKSGDLILVVGAKDIAAPAGFNPPTATVAVATATPTPTPTVPGPSPTPTRTATPGTTIVNLTATQFQWTFTGADGASDSTFTAKVGQTYQLQIRDGDPGGTTPHGFSGIPSLGISAFSLTAGSSSPRIATFTPTSNQLGGHFFSCSETSCGSGHDSMLGTIRVVSQ